MNEFDDIRPFDDTEVAAVLQRVLRSEELVQAITRLRFPRCEPWLGWLLRPLVNLALRRRAHNIQSVRQVQEIVGELMQAMIDKRVQNLSVSGLEHLRPDRAYLFISNHRDIAMDPAFVNWVLFQNNFDTVRIAIGDNLLTKPYVSDLMRLNKSFIVKRSAASRREKLQASRHLSAYIHHSIVADHSNVWIAQREGRAKDGQDATNAAVISMLTLCRPKGGDYAGFVRSLNIVPVAISYEWDPCDIAKARELHALKQHGAYAKAEHEDVESIARGIDGNKGCVHLAFGRVLDGDYANAEDVAAAIDRQVWDNYVLHPSNLVAYELLTGENTALPVGAPQAVLTAEQRRLAEAELQRRLDQVPYEQRGIVLRMYANPVLSKLQSTPS